MLITWKRSLETKNFLSLFFNAMRYNAKVPVGDLWDYVSNTECLTKDCVTQYIIKWDGKRWVADTLCDPDCPDIEQMLENYYTKEEVNNIINQIEDHDTTYQAGDYITITGPTNIISADIQAIKEAVDTDTTYTAGDYIIISDTNVISADYQALKDAIDTDTTYTAGTNIQISANNVISATDTTYEAGDYITITGPNNTISADIEAIKDAVDTDTTYTAGDYINISNTNVISADIQAIKDAVDTDTTYTAGDHIEISSSNVISANLDEYPTRTEIQNNYYNKTQVDEIIAGLEDHDTTYEAGNYITITGPNNTISADIEAIKEAVDTDTTYTAGENVQISSSNVISATDTTYTAGDHITITGADNAINADLSDYYNKTEINEIIEGIEDHDTTYTAGDYITITGANNAINADIEAIKAQIEDHDTTYTAGDHITITGADNAINADLSDYYNKTEVNELILSITPGGEPIIYTAGNNVQISSDHVISATDTTYSAGDYINISSSNVISADIQAIKDAVDTDTTYTAGDYINISSSNVISADIEAIKDQIEDTDTTYAAGVATSITGANNNINVKYDNNTIKVNSNNELYADFSSVDVDNVPKFDSAFARITLNGASTTFSNAFITNETMVTYVITNGNMPAGIVTMTVDNGSLTISSTTTENNLRFLVKFDKVNEDSTILS